MSELIEFQKSPRPGADTPNPLKQAPAVTTPSFIQSLNTTVSGFERTTSSVLALPFDVAREVYSKAVQVGILQNSMLASRDFSIALNALEKTTLGPWARRV